MSETLIQVKSMLNDVIAFIDGQPTEVPSPAPSPAPAPAPVASTILVPATFQLFGPTQANGALVSSANATPAFAGNALTASTKFFPFALGQYAKAKWARIVVVWASGSSQNKVRIISMEDGPTNIQEMALVSGLDSPSPIVGGAMITDQFNALVDGGVNKHIGFQMQGNGTQYTIYEVRLEVAFEVPVVS